jgi:AdoMet-dependent rRNA methyltransferase SPB1
VIQKGSTSDGDDFEVVPAAVSDDNVDMWDAENNNEDEIKQEHIKGMASVAH